MDHTFLISAMVALKKQLISSGLFLLILLHSLPAAAGAGSVPPPETPVVVEGYVSTQKYPLALTLPGGAALFPALLAPQDLPPLLPRLDGQRIEARAPSLDVDRHGRHPAQIVLPDDGNRWWQASVVAAGLARVWSNAPADATLNALLAAEETARLHRQGHWGSDWQVVCAATPKALRTGAFTLIHGQIHRASLRQGTLWLDFGPDWRQATAATLPAPVLKTLPKPQRQPAFWTGKTVEVRGWVQNGPRLDLTASGQIRQLPDSAAPCSPGEQAE